MGIPNNMRAAFWEGPKKPLKLITIQTPRVASDQDIIIKVKSAMFGASLVRASTIGHPKITPPAVLGTLLAGDIVEAGSKSPLPVGTKVTIDPHPSCLSCFNCRTGRPSLCLNKINLEPGAISEYVRVQNSGAVFLHQIPSNIEYCHAVFTEIIACAIESIMISNLTIGDNALIIGAGPVGLIHTQLASLCGAIEVFCLHNNARRVEVIREFGAIPINGDTDEKTQKMMIDKQTENQGVNAVFEVVGSAKTYHSAIKLVRSGGTVVGFGGCPPNTVVEIDPNWIHYYNISLKGSYHYRPGLFERALRLLVSNKIKLKNIITHRLPLNQIDKAPEVASSKDCISLMISFD